MLEKYLNQNYIDASSFREAYITANPFPHIIFDDFLHAELIERVLLEFPDLSTSHGVVKKYNNEADVKYASQGTSLLLISTGFGKFP